MATPDERLATLEAKVDQLIATVKKMRRPNLQPAWGTRTCKYGSEEAVVLDLSDDAGPNGEGYCMEHATQDGILDGEHVTRPKR